MVKLVVTDYKELIDSKKEKVKNLEIQFQDVLMKNKYFSQRNHFFDDVSNDIDKYLEEYQKIKTTNKFNCIETEYALEILSKLYRNIEDTFKIPLENMLNFGMVNLVIPLKRTRIEEMQEKEMIIFLNHVFKIFLSEWSRNKFFNDQMRYKMFKGMNKKRPNIFSQIQIGDFQLNITNSDFRNFKVVEASEKRITFDFDLYLCGDIRLILLTSVMAHRQKYNFIKKMKKYIDLLFSKPDIEGRKRSTSFFSNFFLDQKPTNQDQTKQFSDVILTPEKLSNLKTNELVDKDLIIGIKVTHLFGPVRITYRPRELGKSTFSFMETPKVLFSLESNLKGLKWNPEFSFLNSEEFLLDVVLKGFVYPDFVSIGIPLTKKNKKTAYGIV